MKHRRISLSPIGVIRSGHKRPEKTPIQPVFAGGCTGRAEVFRQFEKGLRDLDGFSHIYLIYSFHKSARAKLTVKPFLQDIERGVFATRAPSRPNAIGLSIVRLNCREGNILYLDGLDVLDKTPLLDIKPYIRRFDRIESTRNGWQDEVDEETARIKGSRKYQKETTMPKVNGTGPNGNGPGTGRGMGPCGGGQRRGPSAVAGNGQGRRRGGQARGTGRGGRGMGRGQGRGR